MASQQAYLEWLTFGSQDNLPKIRAGCPIYSGSLYRFKEWQFNIRNRLRSVTHIQDEHVRREKMASLTASLIDAFSDDALKIAMDLSEHELAADNAVQAIMDRIKANSARCKEDEARELHRAGSRMSGPLSVNRASRSSAISTAASFGTHDSSSSTRPP